ncbi:hypothetical protein [Nocardia aobensis]|uniref:hypothetical protein n=1 Tax=Nocardia aobensis TaxID=257277 RepID=UPI0012F6DAA1|nr:hypothetical protein [Nocardia aobensis]
MKVQRFVAGVFVAAGVTITGGAIASAAPAVSPVSGSVLDPSDYLVGDTVYFSTSYANCSMHANGDVGCDISPGTANLWGIPINDLVISLPFLPAHPNFGLMGPHGRAGSRSIDPGATPDGYDYGGMLRFGGATCSAGGRAALSCSSKGHSFSFGSSGTTVS